MATKAKAVLISDVHYGLNTVDTAGAAVRQAMDYAAKRGLPLIVAGDLHDTKAILRGECVSQLINLFKDADCPTYVLIGNHDLINEKGQAHSLEFLRPYTNLIQAPVEEIGLYFIPYQNSAEAFLSEVNKVPKGETIVCHQGVKGAYMGEYIVDRTSVDPKDLADWRIISGHYHRAQDIKCGRPRKGAVGMFSYIGTPYTITFAEANDGPKGFRVLMDDGTLTQVETIALRKHVIIERTFEELYQPAPEGLTSDDLIWLKLTGAQTELDKLKKKEVGEALFGHSHFKFDKIPNDIATDKVDTDNQSNDQILDSMIQSSDESPEQKTALMHAWRALPLPAATKNDKAAGLVRVGKCSAENFQSYSSIEFDYNNLGLSLVMGPTGAGKSTLLDLAPWVLFGITSKEGAVDDVRSWLGEGITTGRAEVMTATGPIEIVRIRGARASQNDLYYRPLGAAEPIRGKDASDTQRLIEVTLGVTPELFLIGSYMHQFSKADSFFIAKPKERRKVLEDIADQSFAIDLANAASEARKVEKKNLEALNIKAAQLDGKITEMKRQLQFLMTSDDQWNSEQAHKVSDVLAKSQSFQADTEAQVEVIVSQLEELDKITVPPGDFKKRLEQMDKQILARDTIREELQVKKRETAVGETKLAGLRAQLARLPSGDSCPVCYGPTTGDKLTSHREEIEGAMQDIGAGVDRAKKEVDRLTEHADFAGKMDKAFSKLETEKNNNERLLDKFESLQARALALRSAANPYDAQLKMLEAQKNPFSPKIDSQAALQATAEKDRAGVAQGIKLAENNVALLSWLYDRSFELRGLIMSRAVRAVNNSMNAYLDKYFDAALRVRLEVGEGDSLELEISNDGFTAPFRQLSGGERCMLKLTFSLALMAAAQEKASVSMPMVMLDEGLNGLSDDLKAKAFGLLQDLEQEYSTVLLIDHCEEFKTLFSNRFLVTKRGGASSLTQVRV